MDFPWQSKVIGELKPGGTAKVDLYVLFNQSVLDLEEDISAQVNVKISYNAGSEENEVSVSDSRAITLYRRTALRWDNSGKLASFITPHEDAVERFSHSVFSSLTDNKSASGYTLPDKFLRAVKISDTLGSYGVKYVEDPDSPISRVLGKVKVEDTVRFPRKTLLIRSGDCDDTTALLCSLMESAGIETAIMTSPGHVFMAFNNGEPVKSSWMFTTDSYAVVPFKGSLWIPVETTVLERGFMTAWKTASDIYRRNKSNGKIEFLPVAEEQTDFPPISLPKSIFHITLPDTVKTLKLSADSINKIDASLYGEVFSAYNRKAGQAKGRRKAYFMNRIGILNARFGRNEEARETFETLIRKYPDYISSYVNLANLYLLESRVKEAEGVLKKAVSVKPYSAVINLKLALIYYGRSEKDQVLKYFLKARKAAPAVAERYSYLLNGSAAAGKGEGLKQRADNAGESLKVLWDDSLDFASEE